MMSDPRSLLERESRRFIQQDGAFERLVRRRDRKRRNQRIAAGVVGIAVFVAAVWVVTSGLAFDRSTPAVPGSETGPTSAGTRANTAVTIRHQRRMFGRAHLWGIVESTRPFKCAKDRNVIVFGQLGLEQDPQTDVEVASARAAFRGERYVWGLTLSHGGGLGYHGRFYARVRRTEFCKADSSETAVVGWGGG
jgi:hypothetical protein